MKSTWEVPKVIRALSLDGGGIYGYTTALWIKHLCEQDPDFLQAETAGDIDIHKKGYIFLYAGISAGALNALLLAKYENPREAVLNGELEAFWNERISLFSNTLNPVSNALSMMGMGGSAGEQDFLSQLEKYFGNRTMEDLPQNVLVMAFNWIGTEPVQFPASAVSGWTPFWPLPLAQMSPAWGVTNMPPPGVPWWPLPSAFSAQNIVAPMGSTPSWEPKFFTNHPADPDRKMRVVDVAYGAATALGSRAVRGGIGDAAIYNSNPSADALAVLFHFLACYKEGESYFKVEQPPGQPVTSVGHSSPHTRSVKGPGKRPGKRPPRGKPPFTGKGRGKPSRLGVLDIIKDLDRTLEKIHLLAIGNGYAVPAFWLRSFDLSFQQMMQVPTNPFTGYMNPPMTSVMFDGALTNAANLTQMLLTRKEETRYHRLSPGILTMPVAMASNMARYDAGKDYLMETIRQAVLSPASVEAVASTATFLENGWVEPAPDFHYLHFG